MSGNRFTNGGSLALVWVLFGLVAASIVIVGVAVVLAGGLT